jgi:hypothetical protein
VLPHVTQVFVISFQTAILTVAVVQLQLKFPIVTLDAQVIHLASGSIMPPTAHEHLSPIHVKVASRQEQALALIFLTA